MGTNRVAAIYVVVLFVATVIGGHSWLGVSKEPTVPAAAPVQDPVSRAALHASQVVLDQLAGIKFYFGRGELVSPAIPRQLREQRAVLAMYPSEPAVVVARKAIDHALRACEVANKSGRLTPEWVKRFNRHTWWAEANAVHARQIVWEQLPVTTP